MTIDKLKLKLKDEILMKVEFCKIDNSTTLSSNQNIITTNIDFYELINLIKFIEDEFNALGYSLHKRVFTGVDELTKKGVDNFNHYIIWTDKSIFKFKFDENWIPFNDEILKRKRDEGINKILNKNNNERK